MIKKTQSNEFEDHYEINSTLGLMHYKGTKEFALVNYDDGEAFLLADYEEARAICHLILGLVVLGEIGENSVKK